MTKSRMVIGVSKLSDNYARWLNNLNSGLEIVDFYSEDPAEIASHFHVISGLLLSGGADINPGLYSRKEDLTYCQDIDDRRDKMELALIELALTLNIPVLGICRGLQMLNVAQKGSLYADIQTFVERPVPHRSDEGDVYHPVRITPESLLYRLTLTTRATVNSSHHQAIHRTGDGLTASAFSTDGIIEAIELNMQGGTSFCLAVQWHPERMEMDNPMSGLLGKGFLEAAGER